MSELVTNEDFAIPRTIGIVVPYIVILAPLYLCFIFLKGLTVPYHVNQYTDATNIANDTRRKADLSQLVSAIQIIKTQDGSLPVETNANCKLGSTNISENCSGIQAKLSAQGIAIPKDPVTGNYYTYNRVSADDFTIKAITSDTNIYTYNSANSKYSSSSSSFCVSGGGLTCAESTNGSYKINKYTLSGATTGTVAWTIPTGVTSIEYLVIGGGGGGGGQVGGGGGAGGFLTGSLSVSSGNIDITVGAGGIGGNYPTTYRGGTGSNSVLSYNGTTITASGGGGGGGYGSLCNGNKGGSGGGAGYAGTYGTVNGTPSSQGNNGGTYSATYSGGGGGGAGSAGLGGTGSGDSAIGGAGGAGLPSSITGSVLYYAGGGSGCGQGYRGAAIDGGGAGSGGRFTTSYPGTDGTGGGGGGGRDYAGGKGGSGVVIIKFIAP